MKYNLGELIKHEMIQELLRNPFNTMSVVAGCAFVYTSSNFAAANIEHFKVKGLNNEEERMSNIRIREEERMSNIRIREEERMSNKRIREFNRRIPWPFHLLYISNLDHAKGAYS